MNAPDPRDGEGTPASPEAVTEHYRSVDSAPHAYASRQPASVTNGFFVSFLASSILALLGLTVLVNAGIFAGSRDLVIGAQDGDRALVPARLFITVFFVTLALSLRTDWWRRLALAAELVLWFGAVVLLVDASALLADRVGVPTPVVGQQIISGLAAMVVLPAVVLRRATLPAPVTRPCTGRIRWHAWVRLVLPLLLGFAVAGLVEVLFADAVVWLRSVALLGGVGPGVFLVQQVFAVVTAGTGVLMVRRSRRRSFAPPVAVLVPAHNEAHLIAATVAAVDRAAAAYDGAVRLYVVDNASTDTTRAVAETAIARCRALGGEVLSCTEPGKALALNFGLARIEEEFVVRIDADTEVGERCLDLALRHLADPAVGAVGGIPLPARLETWIDKVRLVEVLLRHGFFQVSLMGYDGILGLPGMFVVYRRKALDEVGPIVEGMNGEDTDICLRMAGAGYRNVVETRALYRSETPAGPAHLREQRTRWFRSIYHVTAHNRHAVFGRHSVAGAVVLPFQLASAARRAMLAPVLVFALLILTVFREDFPGLNWQPVVATVIGLPMFMAVAVCLAHRQWRALLYVPAYLVFRVGRSYLTLGALLSLVFPPLRGAGKPRDG